jgi:signal transduction histidine kinase
MLHTAARMNMFPRPWRLAAWFLSALAAGAVTGLVYEYLHLGWSEADAARTVAADVRRDFDAMVIALDRTAASVADRRDLIVRATTDVPAARELFAALVLPDGRDLSITIYTADAVPLAWAGRPSDLPRARLTGPSALLVAPGASGPRLARVQPVIDATAKPPRRVGTVVAESPLPSTRFARGLGSESLTWPSSLVPVSLRAGYEGAGEARSAGAFVLTDSAGKPLLEGRVAAEDIAAARRTVRARTRAGLLAVCALFCLWVTAPLLAWRRVARTPARAIGRSLVIAGLVLAARALAWMAVPLAGLASPMGTLGAAPTALRPWLRSPLDFLLTAIAALALVALLSDGVTRLRVTLRRVRRPIGASFSSALIFVLFQLAAGLAAATGLARYLATGRILTDAAAIDWLTFSLHPWEMPRLAVAAGLVFWHATAVWGAVTVLRLAASWWRFQPSPLIRIALLAVWLLPFIMWAAVPHAIGPGHPGWVMAPPAILTVALAWGATRLLRWRRRSSQAASYVALFLALALPSLSMYPAAFAQADRAKRRVIETKLAPQATRQRDDVQLRVRRAMTQVDAVANLTDLVRGEVAPAAAGPVPTEYAFLVWSQTDLAAFRLTSAIELYGEDGALTSRFALNLPEYTQTQQRWQETGCEWELFEEVSPFGSEERRLLHAGRGLCTDEGGRPRMVGTIVIHAMLDYGTLPFITSQNPYIELFRNQPVPDVESSLGRDVAFVVYGWSLRPNYTSGSTAWTLDADTFRRVYASREPFWTRQASGERQDEVYLANDRGGIFALGYPTVSPVGHLVYLAELVTLVGAAFAAMVLLTAAGFSAAGVRGERGRDLLHEIRASFYRKLFLAFVAVAVIPVLTLAFVARAYMTGRLRADVEDAAIRTTTVAQRFVEDYGRIQERGEGAPATLNDDVIVGISRFIDQDVNVFDGPRLVATSERDLFASGLLPTRTSADVYRAIVLDRQAAFVGEERAGQFPYMVAAAPVRIAGLNALLTVPLTLRQRAIEREIDDLNRRILLAVLAFILIGSALGYWMAERIADPVNRLQRATARLARGDLGARVALTSSDELRRLVEAFNGMAAELQRQQGELERTHRLEAWADMARQVAHEIKNPLTPIQLSAEHLRRVHADRGMPLSPVLEGCVDSILGQVRLLRQIAAEFSSFASSPTPRPVLTSPADLVAEVVEPYRSGLPARITLQVNVAPSLPAFNVDRSMVGRALTNMIENALHAMPGGGVLVISGAPADDGRTISLEVRDSGVGMDRAALSRIFEPYFSTKAVGTGLGLTIAKRNIELHHGTISVESTPGAGTTVTIGIPIGPTGPAPASSL